MQVLLVSFVSRIMSIRLWKVCGEDDFSPAAGQVMNIFLTLTQQVGIDDFELRKLIVLPNFANPTWLSHFDHVSGGATQNTTDRVPSPNSTIVLQ